jgi:hypothetical protein
VRRPLFNIYVGLSTLSEQEFQNIELTIDKKVKNFKTAEIL